MNDVINSESWPRVHIVKEPIIKWLTSVNCTFGLEWELESSQTGGQKVSKQSLLDCDKRN